MWCHSRHDPFAQARTAAAKHRFPHLWANPLVVAGIEMLCDTAFQQFKVIQLLLPQNRLHICQTKLLFELALPLLLKLKKTKIEAKKSKCEL